MHPGLFSSLGLALASVGVTLASPPLAVAGGILFVVGVTVWTLTVKRRPWDAWRRWGFQRGLTEDSEDYDFSLKGAHRGHPVLVHFENDRVHAACRLEGPVERSFPASAPAILSHIQEADALGRVPTPALQDPATRSAWRQALEDGMNVRVVRDEVRVTVTGDVQTYELEEALDNVIDLAEHMLLRRTA